MPLSGSKTSLQQHAKGAQCLDLLPLFALPASQIPPCRLSLLTSLQQHARGAQCLDLLPLFALPASQIPPVQAVSFNKPPAARKRRAVSRLTAPLCVACQPNSTVPAVSDKFLAARKRRAVSRLAAPLCIACQPNSTVPAGS